MENLTIELNILMTFIDYLQVTNIQIIIILWTESYKISSKRYTYRNNNTDFNNIGI